MVIMAYESAEQKPKQCLTPGFLIPLLTTEHGTGEMEEVSFCWKGLSASAQVGPPFRKKKKVILDNGEQNLSHKI